MVFGAKFLGKRENFNTKLHFAFENFQGRFEEKKAEEHIYFTNSSAVKKVFFENFVLSLSAQEFEKRIWQEEHSAKAYKLELHEKLHIDRGSELCFDMFYYELFCELMKSIVAAANDLFSYGKELSVSSLEEMYIKNYIANEVFAYFYDEYEEAQKLYNSTGICHERRKTA